MSILVVIEVQDGRPHPASLETLVAGQSVAGDLGGPLVALVPGAAPDEAAAALAAWRVDEVVALAHPLLEAYTPDAYTAALQHALAELSPKLVLFPHTYQVRDFGPKLATRLERPFVSDVVKLAVADGRPVFVRQLFQGKLNADVVVDGEPPWFASLQAGAYRADQLAKGDAPAPVRRIEPALDASAVRTKAVERFRESKAEVDLSSADVIVSVGRGIKDPENLPVAEKLAAALGGELAGSRPVIDNGWLPLERQVGSSGQSVAPKLYLALGISGAIQHVVGMKGSKTIVAVNKDESAPIFEIADYGIVGDLFEVAPALLAELEK